VAWGCPWGRKVGGGQEKVLNWGKRRRANQTSVGEVLVGGFEMGVMLYLQHRGATQELER